MLAIAREVCTGGPVYPAQGMNEVDTVTQLERWLEDLARRWERFFAHDPKVPVPPDRERSALERRLRDASRTEYRSTAENFRLEQLLHRFMTYNQLWIRQLREREEARVAAAQAAKVLSPPNTPPTTLVPPVGAGYEALHRRYVEALQGLGSRVSVNFERFRETLEMQRRLLEAKGVTVEGYEVVQEGTQVKVKARVRKGTSK
jgi:hypothetical protein